MRCNELFITLTYAEFQSTHPVWGETAGICRAACRRLPFQSTHPVWDGTIPGGFYLTPDGISIHPSRVGWDAPRTFWPRAGCHFNPPIPCGMGLTTDRAADATSEFQSTHPVWDGTDQLLLAYVSIAISIHPARVGWDSRWRRLIFAPLGFQSTHPVWDGTAYGTSPRTVWSISIHPSRVGWDGFRALLRVSSLNFNPPIPCGMGPDLSIFYLPFSIFQSTHPVWDGTRLRTR